MTSVVLLGPGIGGGGIGGRSGNSCWGGGREKSWPAVTLGCGWEEAAVVFCDFIGCGWADTCGTGGVAFLGRWELCSLSLSPPSRFRFFFFFFRSSAADRRGSTEDLADEGGKVLVGWELRRLLEGCPCKGTDNLKSSASGRGVTGVHIDFRGQSEPPQIQWHRVV